MESNVLHNKNIKSIEPLPSPTHYWRTHPITQVIQKQITGYRELIEDILMHRNQRLLVIVGPCSIHDPVAGIEYAKKLKKISDQLSDQMMIAMRVYFEKPRTALGWKGYINDPNLNDTFDVKLGLTKGREFLLQIAEIGLPAATEYLDPFTPQFLGDLVSWGAIGARTTESQPHRVMASGLSMPIGFKNGTGGSIQIAIDAIIAAKSEHVFMGIDANGLSSVVSTNGNPNTHLVLRGGKTGPNFDSKSIQESKELLNQNKLTESLIVDCSHANSNKDHRNQPKVFENVLNQRINGASVIRGLMLESHLNEGNQQLSQNISDLDYGVSITDSCMGWEQTEELLTTTYKKLTK